MMEIKGIIAQPLQNYMKIRGEEDFKKWLSVMPEEAKKIFNDKILNGLWYPYKYACYHGLKAYVDAFHAGNTFGIREYGEYSAQHGLSGPFALIVKMGSPKILVSKIDYIASSVFRPCKVETMTNEKGHFVFRFTQFEEWEELIEIIISVWLEHAFQISKHRLEYKINKSMSKGDPFTEFEGNWT